jgi:D-alanine transaminase
VTPAGWPREVYLNGQIVPRSEAWISFEDRGFQYADGVYEVARSYDVC